MQYADDFQRIKESIDIKQEIERRTGQTTKPDGKGHVLPECPFCAGHNCFKISATEHLFNCFQCSAGGSVIDFVMKQAPCSEKEAIVDLAGVHGIEINAGGPGGEARRDNGRDAIFETAAEYYHRVLMVTRTALSYQNKARQHDSAILKKFHVGYTDGNLHGHLIKQGFTEDQIIASGLVKSHADAVKDVFWPGQYIYPHVGKSGKIGDFTTKKPNSKNNPRLCSEYKDPDCLFFNMPAFNSDTVILVEGQNDLLSVFGRGECQSVAACCGQLSKGQIDFIKQWASRRPGKTIFLCFDNDKQGNGYREKIENELSEQCLSDKIISINRKFANQERDVIEADQREEESEPSVSIPLAKTVRLKAIRFDEKFKDIDEFLKQTDKPAEAMRSLMENAEVFLAPLKRLLSMYRGWCHMLDIKAGSNEIGEIIFDYFQTKGQYFVDGDKSFLFFRSKIYEIGNNMPFKSMLYELAGVNYANSSTRQIFEVLQAKAYEYGRHTQVPGWIHTDLENKTIYFNLNNDKNEILRISPGNIEIILNGTNTEKILLNSSPKMRPLQYLQDVDIQGAMNDFNRLFMKNLACNASDKFFIAVVVMNTILIQYTKARGITKFSGTHASGKTGGAALITTLVYGQDYVTIGSPAADFSEATRSPITIQDNLESDTMSKTQRDFLLVAATGITKQKRKSGTDSENVYERVQTQVIVTAIEPFSEGELISRTNDIFFGEKYFDSDFVEATEIESKLVSARDRIWSAIFKIIAHDVLPGFTEKRKSALNLLKNKYAGHSKSRLNELYSCLFILCGELLKYVPHPEHSAGRLPDLTAPHLVLNDWIEQQDRIDRATAGETNPILYRLELLLREYIRNPEAFRQTYLFECVHNLGGADEIIEVRFILSTSELYSAFEVLAKNRGGQCPYRNVRQLGARLNDSMKVLEAARWRFQPRIKTVRGEPKHVFMKTFDD